MTNTEMKPDWTDVSFQLNLISASFNFFSVFGIAVCLADLQVCPSNKAAENILGQKVSSN